MVKDVVGLKFAVDHRSSLVLRHKVVPIDRSQVQVGTLRVNVVVMMSVTIIATPLHTTSGTVATCMTYRVCSKEVMDGTACKPGENSAGVRRRWVKGARLADGQFLDEIDVSDQPA